MKAMPSRLMDDINDPDHNWLLLARKGDTEAFENLYRKYVARIYATLLRLLANSELAKEQTQESFIKAWQKLPEFRGESRFSSWLHRIACNQGLSVLRKNNLLQFEEAEVICTETIGLQKDLESAIAKLPAAARTVLVLSLIEGYTHAEIAEITGMAVGTSKAQLHRAKRILKNTLDENDRH